MKIHEKNMLSALNKRNHELFDIVKYQKSYINLILEIQTNESVTVFFNDSSNVMVTSIFLNSLFILSSHCINTRKEH
jgi:hypothetical protein